MFVRDPLEQQHSTRGEEEGTRASTYRYESLGNRAVNDEIRFLSKRLQQREEHTFTPATGV